MGCVEPSQKTHTFSSFLFVFKVAARWNRRGISLCTSVVVQQDDHRGKVKRTGSKIQVQVQVQAFFAENWVAVKRHETHRTGSNLFAQAAGTGRTASNLFEPFPWLGLVLAWSIPAIGAWLYVWPPRLLAAWHYG